MIQWFHLSSASAHCISSQSHVSFEALFPYPGALDTLSSSSATQQPARRGVSQVVIRVSAGNLTVRLSIGICLEQQESWRMKEDPNLKTTCFWLHFFQADWHIHKISKNIFNSYSPWHLMVGICCVNGRKIVFFQHVVCFELLLNVF